VSLRYFNVYGPGQTGGDYAGVIPTFIDRALSGKDMIVHGDGEQTRDFVYVEDVSHANILAAKTATVGEAYNVATGDSISVRELAEKIHEMTDSSSDIVHTKSRSGDIEHSVADISKAAADLGYEPSITLQEGLEQTIKWWQNRNPRV
jgi:UDP-glucose 4-epimerase